MDMVALLGTLVAAWLVGSVPTAYLVGRAYGMDLRTVGSGNLGATNAMRSIGWHAGLFVYAVDTLKGYLPVVLGPAVLLEQGIAPPNAWGIVLGLVAIWGHVRPVFLRGNGGGKGVATASGVFLALDPVATGIAMGAFAIVVALTRYVSLGSLVAAATLAVVMVVRHGWNDPLVIVATLVAAFVVYTHRANVVRLRSGTESRLGARRAEENVSRSHNEAGVSS
jgi:glycerol-3-phosphate acyltransferase PlsY